MRHGMNIDQFSTRIATLSWAVQKMARDKDNDPDAWVVRAINELDLLKARLEVELEYRDEAG